MKIYITPEEAMADLTGEYAWALAQSGLACAECHEIISGPCASPIMDAYLPVICLPCMKKAVQQMEASAKEISENLDRIFNKLEHMVNSLSITYEVSVRKEPVVHWKWVYQGGPITVWGGESTPYAIFLAQIEAEVVDSMLTSFAATINYMIDKKKKKSGLL